MKAQPGLVFLFPLGKPTKCLFCLLFSVDMLHLQHSQFVHLFLFRQTFSRQENSELSVQQAAVGL